jgi:hypothetical protein
MAQNQFYNSFSRFVDLLKPEKREIGIIGRRVANYATVHD